jgi:D-alanine-D-alanine ligase
MLIVSIGTFMLASAVPRVYLVAENIPHAVSSPGNIAASYCVTTGGQANEIVNLLEGAGFKASIISDLRRLAQLSTASEPPFLIFPHWHGSQHRNRRTTVTGLCEAFALPFIGADSYLRAVCGDKHLSKMLASQYGFQVPRVLRICNANDRHYASEFPFPAIVKPNYLGASVGIDNSNIAAGSSDAQPIVSRLLGNGFPDIVIEEYIAGREITVSCYHEIGGNIRVRAGERYVVKDPDYFVTNVYDTSWKYTGKFFETDIREYRPLPSSVTKAIEAFMAAECPKGYCRFDFRVNDAGWYLMEITPDPLMTPSSEFLLTLARNGIAPSEALKGIVTQAGMHKATINAAT